MTQRKLGMSGRLLALGVVLAAAAGIATAIAVRTVAEPAGRPGEAPADMQGRLIAVGECGRATSFHVRPPRADELAGFRGAGWASASRFVGGGDELATAAGAIESRTSTDWAWIRTPTALRGFVRFEVDDRSVWVEIETVEKVPCPAN